MRGLVESNLYGQFPNIEIHQVPDYTAGITYDLNKYKFGKLAHLVLTKADGYPIKTYIDYGLDKDAKEEYKVDPLATVIEFLGSFCHVQVATQALAPERLVVYLSLNFLAEQSLEVGSGLRLRLLQERLRVF